MNTLNGRVLNVEESQKIGLGKSRGGEGENSDGFNKWWGDKYTHKWKQLSVSPNLSETNVYQDKHQKGYAAWINWVDKWKDIALINNSDTREICVSIQRTRKVTKVME